MNDLISRQAAVDALKGLPTWWADEGGFYGGAQPPMIALLDPEDAVSAIENLPSAQQERKKGKWIPYLEEHHDMFKCSNCGNITRVPFKCFSPPYRYCPNCGADMRGENNDDPR